MIMEKENHQYMVMKMQKTVQVNDPISGQNNDVEIEGLAGYVPVFHTIEEAEESSADGKYDIIPIKAG